MSEIQTIIPGAMYLSAGGSLFTMGSIGEKIPTQSRLDPKLAGPFVPWGRNNKLCYEMAEVVRASTVLAPAMRKMSRLLYGDGIIYEVETKDEKGNSVWIEGNDPEIDDWIEETDLASYFRNACFYYYFYENVQVGLQTTINKKKINRIWVEKTEQVRYAWQDENGYIPLAFISANWKLSNDITRAIQVPILDPTYSLSKQIEKKAGCRFLIPLSLEDASPDENFYTTPAWYSAVLSNWVDFAKSIPEFKSAMMKNQVALKYHIEIDTRYWTFKYGEAWENFGEKERTSIIKQHLTEFNANLSGTKNASNTLITHSVTEGDKTINFWKVTPIDDKIKTGVYIEDSQEATSHLLYSLGCDPALTGTGPGKGFSSGSGSDKNAAYNIFMMEAKPIHDNLLRPVIAASRFNGFNRPDRRVRWKVRRPMMVQMDSGKPKPKENPSAENSNP